MLVNETLEDMQQLPDQVSTDADSFLPVPF